MKAMAWTAVSIAAIFFFAWVDGFFLCLAIYMIALFDVYKSKRKEQSQLHRQAEKIARRLAHEQQQRDKIIGLFWKKFDMMRRRYNGARTSVFGCNMSREQYDMRKRLKREMNWAKIGFDHAVKLHKKGETHELIQYAKQSEVEFIPVVMISGDMQPKDHDL